MKKKRQERQRSIGYVMARMSFIMVMVGMVWISIIAIASNFIATKNLVSDELLTVATTASRSVQWELQSYVNLAEAIGTDSYLLDADNSAEDKQAYIHQKATSHGLVSGDMLDTSGIGLDGTDYSASESFKVALRGRVYISSPMTIANGSKVMFIAAPIWENGVENSNVVGVIYDRLAMGITIDKRKVTTNYAASRDTSNSFYHALVNYVVNDSYPIVMFYIGEKVTNNG